MAHTGVPNGKAWLLQHQQQQMPQRVHQGTGATNLPYQGSPMSTSTGKSAFIQAKTGRTRTPNLGSPVEHKISASIPPNVTLLQLHCDLQCHEHCASLSWMLTCAEGKEPAGRRRRAWKRRSRETCPGSLHRFAPLCLLNTMNPLLLRSFIRTEASPPTFALMQGPKEA